MTTELQMTRQADTDTEALALWLHGRSPHTIRAYRHDVGRFLAFVDERVPAVRLGVRLPAVRLQDLQDFADALGTVVTPVSRARCLAAVKSLLAFAQKIGYLRFNVGVALELPPVKGTLAERIMSEDDVLRMIHSETNPRNHAILRMLYVAGVRVSELCGLRWRHVLAVGDDTAQITVFGKGGKTRAIRLTPSCWRALEGIRGAAGPEAPLFLSRNGDGLSVHGVRDLVRAAAKRAGVRLAVTPHWFRHAHASHALDRGAPIHLVQATLGHASIATTGRYLHARPTESSGRFLAEIASRTA
jgi:integrase/recombinase XerD